MKRGLITWDRTEIRPEVFQNRVDCAVRVLAERELPALAVFSDLWRSNQARFFSNFMPYFNRALLIIQRDMPPILLCGLSPRVYGWIRSVTTIEDVRPAGNFTKPFFEIASERRWSRAGVLDFDQLPYDLYSGLQAGPITLENVESAAVFLPADDDTEVTIRRKTAELAIRILDEEVPDGVGLVDHRFVGRLERRFRRAGAEDLIVLVTNGRMAPAPATGATLEQNFSVSVAVEYRGHWVRITRAHGLTKAPQAEEDPKIFLEKLDGSYPYELGAGKITARHAEHTQNGKRLFYGDTIL